LDTLFGETTLYVVSPVPIFFAVPVLMFYEYFDLFFKEYAFSALTLLVGHQEELSARKS